MEQTTSSQVKSSFGWKFFERVGVQITNLLVSIILARMLSPDEYDPITLILIFINLATVFVQGGFNTALIQKKEVQKKDFSSTLYLSLVVAVVLYLLIYLTAPAMARFYEMQELSPMLRVTALILIPGAFNSVQTAYASRHFRFRGIFISSIIAVFLSAATGIAMAYRGFGAWALVAQQVVYHTTICFTQWVAIRWTPFGTFSWKSIRTLSPFGLKILANNFINALFLDIRSLMIGKVYPEEGTISNFSRGKQFPQAIMESVNGTIQTVLLPVYSKEQDSKTQVISMLRNTMRLSTFLVMPLMAGMAVVARPMIAVVLNESWLGCVFFLQMFCISYILMMMQLPAMQAYRALGDSTTPLVLELIKKTAEIVLLFTTIWISINAVAISIVVCGVISVFIGVIANHYKLKYSLLQQLRDILPSLLLSLGMAAAVYLTSLIPMRQVFSLILQVGVGAVTYVGLAFICRVESLRTLISAVKNRRA